MSRLHLLMRFHQAKIKFPTAFSGALQKQQFSSSSSDNSSSSSSSDDEKKQQRQKSKEALDKLNKLLLTMTGEDVASKSKLNLAQPINRRQKLKDQKPKPPKAKTPEDEIINAAKTVAESIGGDVQQTQSELLMKLLNVNNDVASNNLKDVVKGMKIDQELPQAQEQTKAQQVRQILEGKQLDSDVKKSIPRHMRPPRTNIVVEKIDLFGSEPLGIFTEEVKDWTEGVENTTWNQLHQRDLKLAVTHPPSNYFQQLILWTEQGKVWKFPIDNEQGLEEEKQVYFTEHVFLEKYLEPWCPPKGPLRHFMELVCVGLSKNPYLTVEAKKEHILWYKNYFDDKQQLLKETGLIQDEELAKKQSQQKQIE